MYLLHVGMPQAGSSFLQNVVFPNSDVTFLSPRDTNHLTNFYNPIRFLEDVFYREYEVAEWLGKHSTGPMTVISHEGFSCSQSVTRDLIAERLRLLCGPCKCVIIVRNQFTAIVSLYAQRAQNPSLRLVPFDDFFAYGMRAAQFLDFRRYFYDEFVSMYEKSMGADNVLVLPFEMLQESSDSFLEIISTFAGIRLFRPSPEQKSNVRISRRAILARSVADKLISPEAMRGIWMKFPQPMRTRIKRTLSSGRRYEVQLTDQQKGAIISMFSKSNAALSQRRGLDLTKFGYPT